MSVRVWHSMMVDRACPVSSEWEQLRESCSGPIQRTSPDRTLVRSGPSYLTVKYPVFIACASNGMLHNGLQGIYSFRKGHSILFFTGQKTGYIVLLPQI